MKFQDDISNMNTHIRTSRNQYVPHFFKVGGITKAKISATVWNLSNCKTFSPANHTSPNKYDYKVSEL